MDKLVGFIEGDIKLPTGRLCAVLIPVLRWVPVARIDFLEVWTECPSTCVCWCVQLWDDENTTFLSLRNDLLDISWIVDLVVIVFAVSRDLWSPEQLQREAL